MTDELKLCPFCGEHHLWTYSVSYAPNGLRFVKCSKNPHEDDGCVSGVSVSTWQSRPIEDKLRARVAELEEALKWYADSVHYRAYYDKNAPAMIEKGERARIALKGGE